MYISKQLLNEIIQQKKAKDSKFILNDSYQIVTETHYDIFLSYSFLDLEYAKIIFHMLTELKLKVYMDVMDPKMDRTIVNGETAYKLAKKMDRCKSLIYIYSKASSVSKWCPWELGYMSAQKKFKCAKLPIVLNKTDNTYEKQEYLELYPTIDYERTKESNIFTFWVNSENESKTILKWINT